MTDLSAGPAALIADVRQLVAQARLRTATAVNAELTWLYWQIGQRVHREILGSQRAGYGEEIVSALARQLTVDCGRGFSAKNLHHMVRFAQVFLPPVAGSHAVASVRAFRPEPQGRRDDPARS